MNSNKAIYWIALGAFALGLSSEYHSGNFQFMHDATNRAETAFCHLATNAEQSLAVARVLVGGWQVHVDTDLLARQQREAQRAVAEHQAEIERAMAVRQADLDRVLADHQAGISRAMSFRQTDLDRVQQRLNQMRVVLDSDQVEKIRVLTRNAVRISNGARISNLANGRAIVICPVTGQKISVKVGADVSDLDKDLPEVDDADSN